MAGYPNAKFRYKVEIDGIEAGGFTEVTGSDISIEAIEYREGREEWGAEKGKKYLVEVLGRRTTLDGTKLWED